MGVGSLWQTPWKTQFWVGSFGQGGFVLESADLDQHLTQAQSCMGLSRNREPFSGKL